VLLVLDVFYFGLPIVGIVCYFLDFYSISVWCGYGALVVSFLVIAIHNEPNKFRTFVFYFVVTAACRFFLVSSDVPGFDAWGIALSFALSILLIPFIVAGIFGVLSRK
jgi:prolipoprotein diacylglyceryltransferase